jgi:hypothetical protein
MELVMCHVASLACHTARSDAIADVHISRPLGILLFSQERFARAIREILDPVIWPTLIVRQRDIQADVRPSAGLFYERGGSLGLSLSRIPVTSVSDLMSIREQCTGSSKRVSISLLTTTVELPQVLSKNIKPNEIGACPTSG